MGFAFGLFVVVRCRLPVIASEAKQSSFLFPGAEAGLLRRLRSSQ
jgi:hypothetical protein